MYSIEYLKKSKLDETKLMLSRESMKSASKDEKRMHLMCCDIKNSFYIIKYSLFTDFHMPVRTR